MSWCNAHTKALNFLPKKNSKTQQEKRKKLLDNPVTYLYCDVCNEKNVTLFKVDGKYYCENHKPKK